MTSPADTASAPAPAAGPLVLVTRPDGENRALGDAIRAAGFDSRLTPVIQFADCPAADDPALADRIRRLDRARGWLILPSPTAIGRLAQALRRRGVDPRELAGLRLAVVGAGSNRRLREHWGREADFVPTLPTAAELAAGLPAEPRQPILIVGSRQSRPEVPRGLRRRGRLVESIVLYETLPCPEGLSALREALGESARQARPPVLVVASPSAVEAIFGFFGAAARLPRAGWITIGPTTHARLLRRTAELEEPPPTVQSESPAPEAIVQAIRRIQGRLGSRAALPPRAGDPRP
ncbi:MAG TPA: uroporphyrinogen-III synthase [Candidatus Sumerlaeota bacterium]|nr:uroporphyrinogen-III synthase [Candidatus Sumerlaeota bacterium]